jgi:hypothetical protein
MRKNLLALACALCAAGCADMYTPAHRWAVETAPNADAWTLKGISMHRKDWNDPVDRAVLTGHRDSFDWNGDTLYDVVRTTGYKVHPRSELAEYRLRNSRVNSRFGPMEEDMRMFLVQNIADMYAVDVVPGWSWKLDVLDAWANPENRIYTPPPAKEDEENPPAEE